MATEHSGPGNHRYLCGTPANECSGSIANVSAGLRPTVKRMHGDRGQAMQCYSRWLVAHGSVRMSSRAFKLPNGGPVLILNKRSHFGGHLRGGKAGRSMPESNGFITTTGGLFI